MSRRARWGTDVLVRRNSTFWEISFWVVRDNEALNDGVIVTVLRSDQLRDFFEVRRPCVWQFVAAFFNAPKDILVMLESRNDALDPSMFVRM